MKLKDFYVFKLVILAIIALTLCIGAMGTLFVYIAYKYDTRQNIFAYLICGAVILGLLVLDVIQIHKIGMMIRALGSDYEIRDCNFVGIKRKNIVETLVVEDNNENHEAGPIMLYRGYEGVYANSETLRVLKTNDGKYFILNK